MTKVDVYVNEGQLKELLNKALRQLHNWDTESDADWPKEQLESLNEELDECLGFVHAYKRLVDSKEV